MINRINVIPLALGTFLLCGSLVAPDKRAKVLIATDFGSIKVVLFDETPLHHDEVKVIHLITINNPLPGPLLFNMKSILVEQINQLIDKYC